MVLPTTTCSQLPDGLMSSVRSTAATQHHVPVWFLDLTIKVQSLGLVMLAQASKLDLAYQNG
jgi:hypothetical protein